VTGRTTNDLLSRLINIKVVNREFISGHVTRAARNRSHQLYATRLGLLDVFIAGVTRINKQFFGKKLGLLKYVQYRLNCVGVRLCCCLGQGRSNNLHLIVRIAGFR